MQVVLTSSPKSKTSVDKGSKNTVVGAVGSAADGAVGSVVGSAAGGASGSGGDGGGRGGGGGGIMMDANTLMALQRLYPQIVFVPSNAMTE